MALHTVVPRVNSRFHPNHGGNVRLLEGGAVARRVNSFANAISFSERPLLPGELFLLEIEQNERGWSGYLRLGLTCLDPAGIFPLPLYALPDLTNRGHSWVFAVTKSHNNVYEYEMEAAAIAERQNEPEEIVEVLVPDENVQRSSPLLGTGDLVHTSRGPVPRTMLLPSQSTNPGALPTDVGSRVGLMFVPRTATHADMHFLLNGEDQGPCTRDIPYTSGPLYAVVDVYGSTKQVRIVQLYGVPSLQSACRDSILQHITRNAVSRLPLPKMLIQYLLFQA